MFERENIYSCTQELPNLFHKGSIYQATLNINEGKEGDTSAKMCANR